MIVFQSLISEVTEKLVKLQEQRLVQACEDYDFLVGSHVVKRILEQKYGNINVVYYPMIDENKVFAVARAELNHEQMAEIKGEFENGK